MKLGKSAALVTAGCAAACAGASMLPALLTGAAIGGGGALLSGETGLALAVMVASVVAWILLSRRQTAQGAACGCAKEAGCNTGNACDLPAEPPPLRK